MTDKEFRRLNRMELIEMIRLLRESEARLKSENDDLRAQLADAEANADNLIKSALRRATEIIADAARRSAPPEDAFLADEPSDEEEEPAEIEVKITIADGADDEDADPAVIASDEPDNYEEHTDQS